MDQPLEVRVVRYNDSLWQARLLQLVLLGVLEVLRGGLIIHIWCRCLAPL